MEDEAQPVIVYNQDFPRATSTLAVTRAEADWGIFVFTECTQEVGIRCHLTCQREYWANERAAGNQPDSHKR